LGFDRVDLHRSTLVSGMPVEAARGAYVTVMYAASQGLTLVHFSAQLEPCLTQENTLHTPNTP
jgi:hypothetical protein